MPLPDPIIRWRSEIAYTESQLDTRFDDQAILDVAIWFNDPFNPRGHFLPGMHYISLELVQRFAVHVMEGWPIHAAHDLDAMEEMRDASTQS